MKDFAYVRPKNLVEALSFLHEYGHDTKIIAGGTDVVVDLRAGVIKPEYLLDVSRLAELKGIQLRSDGLWVGAGVTLSEIFSSEVLECHAPALKKCAATFASKQIRNVATIGGNVAHCSPCADTIPPLVIHDADVVLASINGIRQLPLEHVVSGPYTCALPDQEIIMGFILKPAAVTHADFQKIGRRKALATARISMSYMARKDFRGKISFFRFSLGACTPTPRQWPMVEELLAGKVPTENLIWKAARLLSEKMIEITGRRSSTVYKEPAIQGLFVKMLYPMV
ncbi:MAG: hypothetical protein VR64_20405 [Desulfatitalea sp. BRH_c12]|nr:MAG: hypothetical protein VR64_20405 [Desulfatitalea sp. BRH_c12]